MKCVVMTDTGGPQVLEVQEQPLPEVIEDTEIRVALRAAGVNPVDTKLRRRGTFYPERMPAILGCDGAGIVDAVGPKVSRFEVGDEVYFCHGGIGGRPGCYAEYTIVDEKFVARKPQKLSFVEAAALPLVLITAWESLYDRAQLPENSAVLIHGGAGGVGHIAIQLAKRRSATVLTTVSDNVKAAFVRDLGGDEVIFYRDQDFVEAVDRITRGQGVRAALDTVGGEIFNRTIAATAFYGDLVTLLQPPQDAAWSQVRDKNLRVSLELMLTPMLHNLVSAQQHQADILTTAATWVDQGELRVHVERVLPLESAAEAHTLLEQGGTRGKIVLSIDPQG